MAACGIEMQSVIAHEGLHLVEDFEAIDNDSESVMIEGTCSESSPEAHVLQFDEQELCLESLLSDVYDGVQEVDNFVDVVVVVEPTDAELGDECCPTFGVAAVAPLVEDCWEHGPSNCNKEVSVEDECQHFEPPDFDSCPPRGIEAEETLMIFDWDDTMLPSTWIAGEQLRLDEHSILSDEQREQLRELSRCVQKTLQVAKREGTVVLVTNAERGWIELSAHKFMPEVVPLLESCKLISARTAHESPACPHPLDWKLQAFAREMKTCALNTDGEVEEVATFANVLSLGDGAHEREAVLCISSSLPGCRGKSMRFLERPGIGELCRQHRLLKKRLKQLVRHEGDLDICMQRSAERCKPKKRKMSVAFCGGELGELDADQPSQRSRLESVQGFDAVWGPAGKVVSA